MLKVLINCPGGWSHGLDSPERGEGRWAQNLARCLAKSGLYDVSACSGGVPTWGQGVVEPRVALLTEAEARRRGPYDLYFDASWFAGKPPAADALHYFHVHFGYEPRLGVPFLDRHYLIYVLRWSEPSYFAPECGNASRTFFLPAPFGASLLHPDPTRRKIVTTMRNSDASDRSTIFETFYRAVTVLRQSQTVPFEWIAWPGNDVARHAQDSVIQPSSAWGIPYCTLRARLADCGLNTAFDGWSNILDCSTLGIPSLVWEGGAYGMLVDVAKPFDLFLKVGSSVERVAEVVGRLYGDAALYVTYTNAFQQMFSDHVEAQTLARFADIVERVM